MKILIFSDVHGKKERLEAILKAHEDAKYKISLGDSELRTKFLQKHDIIAIKGNYPFDAGFTYEHVLDIEGRTLLLTHGHKYRVKSGYEQFYFKILETEADLAFHGHTHMVTCEEVSGKYILNPGAVNHARGKFAESYITLYLNKASVEVIWRDAYNHNAIKKENLAI